MTVEHVPPKSFFPDGYRTNLFTVPSCAAHNHANSKDVEYVRNYLVQLVTTNQVVTNLLLGNSNRSYARSPKLRAQTLRDSQTAYHGARKTLALSMDMPRFNNVMRAILAGLHYKDRVEKALTWHPLPASLLYDSDAPYESRHAYNIMMALFSAVKTQSRPCSNPEVFSYKSVKNPSEFVGDMWYYELRFYGGFRVIAFAPALAG